MFLGTVSTEANEQNKINNAEKNRTCSNFTLIVIRKNINWIITNKYIDILTHYTPANSLKVKKYTFFRAKVLFSGGGKNSFLFFGHKIMFLESISRSSESLNTSY